MESKKVWLVTGCSKGLGNSLTKKLLESGYHVAATSRNKESLITQFGEESDFFLPVSMDIKSEPDVKSVIEKVCSKFGRIDVVVNNVGYTHLARFFLNFGYRQ